jgi:hypothetical protein
MTYLNQCSPFLQKNAAQNKKMQLKCLEVKKIMLTFEVDMG